MPEPAPSGINPPSRTVGARFSNVQYEAIRQTLGGESDTDYIRRLVAEDMQRQRVDLPGYEFVTNNDRKVRRVRGRGIRRYEDRLGRVLYTAKCFVCGHRRRLVKRRDGYWLLHCGAGSRIEV